MCQDGAKLGHIGGVLYGHVNASAEEVIDGQENVGIAFHFEFHRQLQKANQSTFFSMIDPIRPDGVEANCQDGVVCPAPALSTSDPRQSLARSLRDRNLTSITSFSA